MTVIVILRPEPKRSDDDAAREKVRRENDNVIAWLGGRPPRSRPHLVVDNERRRE
jgi:hypothetical protein